MTYEELVKMIKDTAKGANGKALSGQHLALQINVEGEAAGVFYIEVKENGEVDVEPYEYHDRDAIIYTSADNIIKIMNKKLSPVEAFLTRKIRVEGDVGKAARLEKVL